MDSKQLEQLLEKYWNCETSLEEEKTLRDYFNSSEVPQHLKETADMFRFFENERQRSLGDEFDKQVITSLKNTKSPAKVISMIRWVQVARIAAGLLVVVAASYFVRHEMIKRNEVPDTFSDPKLALEETKKALMMISKSFGKAKQGAGKINLFNEAEQKISGKEKGEEEKKSEEDKSNG